MKLKIGALLGLLTIVGCTSSEPPGEEPRAADRERVFDPLVSTVSRAQGVQQTVDEQAEEQRRRIEEAAR